MVAHSNRVPISSARFFLYKSAKCGKPAEKRRNVDCQDFGQDLTENGLFCAFCAILSEIGPESTSMVGARKSRSERFVCQKLEFALLSRPSAPKGRDLCIFSRGAHFLRARTLKTSEFLGPDSGPISDQFLQKCKKRRNPGKPAAKRRNGLFCTFCAILSEIGPESTSMVGARKSRSERFVCQKLEFALLSRPSAPKGRDLCIFSRGAHFLSARTLKTSEFLDPDSGPIFDPFLQRCKKRSKCGKPRRKAQKLPFLRFLRNFVRNRPRIHVDGRRSKVPVGAIRLSEIGICFVIASVCSERTRFVYFFSRGAFFKRANTKNERIPGSRFWAYF